MTTTPPARRSALLLRAALTLAVGVTAATAAGAQAAPVPCAHGTGPQAETLGVAVAAIPGSISAGRAERVEVHVTRRAADGVGVRDRVAGATVAVRVTAGAATTHVWAHTDVSGIASVQLTPRPGTPAGPATLSAEAWSRPETPLGCTSAVEEHGIVEHGTRVVR